ncbi:hypothetical protein [Gluconacetobacter tumulisoli]|uniref:Uncharacterized protein n=1 Tax=Gluconacetobacter tumulisoli TaxID=1286189 RepID=A0A7W4PN86_9PROT|nr:hypothetical protein [Gluconacetobacter tumulisoli]MBB2200621.1 hypothetical protein [Gluconacetobacter tumulisoli]
MKTQTGLQTLVSFGGFQGEGAHPPRPDDITPRAIPTKDPAETERLKKAARKSGFKKKRAIAALSRPSPRLSEDEPERIVGVSWRAASATPDGDSAMPVPRETPGATAHDIMFS